MYKPPLPPPPERKRLVARIPRAAPTVRARPDDQDVRTLVVEGGLEGDRLVQLAVHQALVNVRQRDLSTETGAVASGTRGEEGEGGTRHQAWP